MGSGSRLPERIVRGAVRRVSALVRPAQPQIDLLEMVWPERRLDQPPAVTTAAGYVLRQFDASDFNGYAALLTAAGMDQPRFEYWENHILPDGFFVIDHSATRDIVAACFASHHPAARHPRAGNLGWLAAHPEHKGKHLGRTVSAAVTVRLIRSGYRRIYLETHDFRLPAIKIYLQLGWVPLLYQEEMLERWKVICDRLDCRFTPEAWPR